MSGTAVASLSAGDAVYFKHAQHSWVLGHVISIEGATVTCRSDDPRRNCTGDVVSKLRADADVTAAMTNLIDEDVSDLLNLTVLHESTLLRCLYIRYMSDVIYTNVGAIVVALNPFTFHIPHYKDDCMQQYLVAPAEGSSTLLPHTWATAHVTYYELLATFQQQFILVSGESGSGKTEASKIVVKYLSAISLGKGSREEEVRCTQCGSKMQRCSPILECFGNAKTVRNDNSSRFGKFMKIQFTKTGVLCGSFTERYLLEKSRVVTAGAGERVYHAFYLLFRSGIGQQLGISLQPEAHYKSINSGNVLRNEDYDTEADAADVLSAMRTVGLDDVSIAGCWRAAAGILHMLNLRFDKDDSGDGCVLSSGTSGDAFAAAGLWGVDPGDLSTELLQTTLVIRNEVSFKRHSDVLAADCRDAICKALYDKLFEWLVVQCNRLCDAPSPSEVAGWIGLLDIFGFEDFKHNSFEQLCINLANESLQGHYNTFVFDKDMEECRAEGIDTVDIPCPNNRPCLDLIEDPKGGILSLLDDQSAMATGTNALFVEACVAMHGGGKSVDFVVERTRRECFSIQHYAGLVRYDASNWVEKNRDTLKDGMRSLMRTSKDPIVAALIDPPADPSAPRAGGKRAFVSTFFRQQLSQLMAIISASNPHWIRCIKPHPAKKPRLFDGTQAMAQLESSGVLGTVKIRKAGYPVRMLFAMFVDRFLIMAPSFQATRLTKAERAALLGNAERCRKVTLEILTREAMNTKEITQMGKTKLFMKADALTRIERARRDFIDRCTGCIKRLGRAYLSRCASGRALVVHAVQLIVAEYRHYCDRSAAERAERARQHAAILEANRRSVLEQSGAFVDAVRLDCAPMLAQRTACLVTFLTELEPMQRRNIEDEARRQWGSMIGAVAYDFLLAQEEVLRHVLANTGPMAQERYYLLMHAYDTLLDDWMEEEDYQRRLLEAEEHNALGYNQNRDFFRARRLAIWVEAIHGHEALVRAWSDSGNANIAAAFGREARMHLTHGLPGDASSRRACESIQRQFLEAEQDAARAKIIDVRVSSLRAMQRAQCVRSEVGERDALVHVESAHRREIRFAAAGVVGQQTLARLQDASWMERCRIAGEESTARREVQALAYTSLCAVDHQQFCTLEDRHRSSIMRREHTAYTSMVGGGVGALPLPHVYAAWSHLWGKEQHWRQAMCVIEAKYRHRVVTWIVSVKDMLRREHWLRRTLFLLHCLQRAEMGRREALEGRAIRERSSYHNAAQQELQVLVSHENKLLFSRNPDAQRLLKEIQETYRRR